MLKCERNYKQKRKLSIKTYYQSIMEVVLAVSLVRWYFSGNEERVRKWTREPWIMCLREIYLSRCFYNCIIQQSIKTDLYSIYLVLLYEVFVLFTFFLLFTSDIKIIVYFSEKIYKICIAFKHHLECLRSLQLLL